MRQILKKKTAAMTALVLFVVVGASAVGAKMLSAQMPPGQPPQSPIPTGMPPDASGRFPGDDHMDPRQREMLARLALQRNAARQQQLVKDTDKLLALATELKTDVDKTNKNVLSIDVIKKAEEIEKLARNVKDRMKD